MLKEIGSEFWNVQVNESGNIKEFQNSIFMLSGRAALDFLIRDIKLKYRFRTVYLPSYCCHTMIEPFISNNVEIKFYNVNADKNGGFKIDINYDMKCDAIFLMKYFGFEDKNIEIISKKCKENGMIIIEDITHSFFLKEPYTQYADYVFGSLRKWTAFYTGGVVKKVYDEFSVELPTRTNELYINKRKGAAELKKEYIEGRFNDKNIFLKMFNDAEELLEVDYKNYLMDKVSLTNFNNLDIEQLKYQRRANAKQLIQGIKTVDFITPIYDEISEFDVPLFIPIIVNGGKRDKFRRHLIENNIYCPIHWGMSHLHNISSKEKEVYENVLSLVCDQRYGQKEIRNFIKIINDFKE